MELPRSTQLITPDATFRIPNWPFGEAILLATLAACTSHSFECRQHVSEEVNPEVDPDLLPRSHGRRNRYKVLVNEFIIPHMMQYCQILDYLLP